MDKLFLKYDKSRIKVGEWLAAEAGSVSAVRNVVGACMTDEAGEFLPKKETLAKLDELTLEELDQAGMQLIRAVQESAVTPTKGSRS